MFRLLCWSFFFFFRFSILLCLSVGSFHSLFGVHFLLVMPGWDLLARPRPRSGLMSGLPARADDGRTSGRRGLHRVSEPSLLPAAALARRARPVPGESVLHQLVFLPSAARPGVHCGLLLGPRAAVGLRRRRALPGRLFLQRRRRARVPGRRVLQYHGQLGLHELRARPVQLASGAAWVPGLPCRGPMPLGSAGPARHLRARLLLELQWEHAVPAMRGRLVQSGRWAERLRPVPAGL